MDFFGSNLFCIAKKEKREKKLRNGIDFMLITEISVFIFF